MNAGRALQAVIALLVAGLLFWSATVQAFFFCFSAGGKGRGSSHSQTGYYPSYGTWRPPPVPVMPYTYEPYTYAPDNNTMIVPVAPVSARELREQEENQGLDYIMPLEAGINYPVSWRQK